MNNYDYPLGSDTSDAPWNQSEPDYVYLPVSADAVVTIFKTISSSAPAIATPYTNEDGMCGYDYELAEDYDRNEVYSVSDNSFENEVSEIARLTRLLVEKYPEEKYLAFLSKKVSALQEWEVQDVEIDNLDQG